MNKSSSMVSATIHDSKHQNMVAGTSCKLPYIDINPQVLQAGTRYSVTAENTRIDISKQLCKIALQCLANWSSASNLTAMVNSETEFRSISHVNTTNRRETKWWSSGSLLPLE